MHQSFVLLVRVMSRDHEHTISSILNLSRKSFRAVRDRASRLGGVHAPHVARARDHRHLAQIALERGAGFSKFVGSMVKATDPRHWWNTFQTWRHNADETWQMTPEDHDMAQMVNQAYKPTDDRSSPEGWSYLGDRSDDSHAVYQRGGPVPSYNLAIRGTQGVADLLPDVHILSGTQELSEGFQESNDVLQTLMADLGGDWRVSGHSLGGTKAMMLAEHNGLESHAFNPGFHAAADDRIDTTYKGHHVFVVKGDPISNTILAREHPDLKVIPSVSLNPLKNHSSENFLREGGSLWADVGGRLGTELGTRPGTKLGTRPGTRPPGPGTTTQPVRGPPGPTPVAKPVAGSVPGFVQGLVPSLVARTMPERMSARKRSAPKRSPGIVRGGRLLL